MSTQELKVDKDFANLIPPLTEDEYSRLEQSILAEGCRESIVVWNDTIIDGHNRYKICKAHNIAFQTIQQEFSSREEVILWMIQNQLGRRNLNDFQRVELVRKYEDTVKAQAEQRMLAGKSDPKVKLPEGQKTREQSRDKLGKLAGVSGSTYEHVVKVQKEAPPPVVEATRNGTISINTAYEVTKMPETQKTEIAERIEKGEAAKSVISEVKSRNRKQNTETATKTANEVSPQSATSETSLRNEEVNVQHEANATAMNNKKPSQEVSNTIHPKTQTQQEDTPRQFQQAETINHVVAEAKECEIKQQPQTTSETSNNTTIPFIPLNQEALQPIVAAGSSQEITTTTQNENELAPEVQIIDIYTTEKKYNIIYANPT